MSFYKILVIGDIGVGKTSLVNRVLYNTFDEKYKATIGCEFGLKVVLFNGSEVKIQLWDLSGQDYLGGISKLYCRNAHGAIVITDATRPESFAKAKEWKELVDIQARLPGTQQLIPMILCVNKSDLLETPITDLEKILKQYAESKNFITGIYMSNKLGINCELPIHFILKELEKHNFFHNQIEKSIVNVSLKHQQRHLKSHKKCCT